MIGVMNPLLSKVITTIQPAILYANMMIVNQYVLKEQKIKSVLFSNTFGITAVRKHRGFLKHRYTSYCENGEQHVCVKNPKP
jgi:hypothetical protein